MTMSVVGGQMNNIQPSCVVGQPMKQLTMNGHIQAERSCTVECICVLYDPVLTNHVSSEITDELLDKYFSHVLSKKYHSRAFYKRESKK